MQQNAPDNLAGSKVDPQPNRRRLQVLPRRRLMGAHAHERHRAVDAYLRRSHNARTCRTAHRGVGEPERGRCASCGGGIRMSKAVPASGPISPAGHGRVEKPWGYEIRWAVTERYAGKLIHVDRGHQLSLQYHVQKEESIHVLSGVMDLKLESQQRGRGNPPADGRDERAHPPRSERTDSSRSRTRISSRCRHRRSMMWCASRTITDGPAPRLPEPGSAEFSTVSTGRRG